MSRDGAPPSGHARRGATVRDCARELACRSARSTSRSSTTRTTCRACSARCSRRRSRAAWSTPGCREGHGDEAARGRLVADFRAFLAPSQPVVLPYFGGTRVDSAERRFRIESDARSPGWWRFAIEGRRAMRDRACDSTCARRVAARARSLDRQLDRRRQPSRHSRGAAARRRTSRVFTRRDPPLVLRRSRVRLRSSSRTPPKPVHATRSPPSNRSATLRDVVPSLRVAFGIALGQRIAREAGVPLSVRELVPRAIRIAEHGRDGVRTWLAELEAERQRAAEGAAPASRPPSARHARCRASRTIRSSARTKRSTVRTLG